MHFYSKSYILFFIAGESGQNLRLNQCPVDEPDLLEKVPPDMLVLVIHVFRTSKMSYSHLDPQDVSVLKI